jgi:hypothetical protein
MGGVGGEGADDREGNQKDGGSKDETGDLRQNR